MNLIGLWIYIYIILEKIPKKIVSTPAFLGLFLEQYAIDIKNISILIRKKSTKNLPPKEPPCFFNLFLEQYAKDIKYFYFN